MIRYERQKTRAGKARRKKIQIKARAGLVVKAMVNPKIWVNKTK